jgi:hypothetical protein
MAFENLRDESLLRFYDSIRKQVETDRHAKHKITSGPSIRGNATTLCKEMTKRRLQYAPIG